MTNVSRLLEGYGTDTDRIMYIYSEESSKSDETVAFWLQAIDAQCGDEMSFVFVPSALSQRFIYKDMIPSSMDNSLTIMKARKVIADPDYLLNKTVFESITSSAAGWVGSLFFDSALKTSKEWIYLSLLKSVMERFVQWILAECEAHHDQLLVVYAARHCEVSHMDLSFSHLVKQAGKATGVDGSRGSVAKSEKSESGLKAASIGGVQRSAKDKEKDRREEKKEERERTIR